MPLDIIQQEIYTGSITLGPTHVILLSLSPSVPYLATPHLCLNKIGCKHISCYFAFPITSLHGMNYWKFTLRCHYLDRYGGGNEVLLKNSRKDKTRESEEQKNERLISTISYRKEIKIKPLKWFGHVVRIVEDKVDIIEARPEEDQSKLI